MKRKQKQLIIIISVLAVILAAALYYGINGLFVAEVKKEFSIQEGMSANAVVSELKDQGLIKSEFVMKMVIKFTGSGPKIQSGSTELSSKMSYFEIKDKLISANSMVKITIPEGYEIDDIVKLVSEKMNISEEELYKELESGEFDYEFITDELPSGRYRLEGYIFPETYFLGENMTAHQVLDTFLAQFDEIYTQQLREDTKKMGFTLHEMVTLASIIEKEGSSELDKISSVFHNRLKSDEFSKLESCATVIYVTKNPKDRLTYEDIEVDSPYNTYKYKGLPPGPIASPGQQAILAAIYPADTDYFYFSAVEGGKNTFSKTYEEHLAKQE